MTAIAKASPMGVFYASRHGKILVPLHQAILDEHLLAVAAGDCPRLIVHAPPQHAKSAVVSIALPVYWLGTRPDDAVLLASYADSLAGEFGGQARDIFTELAPSVFGQSVDPAQSSASMWRVQGRRGFMASSGIGGSLIGRPANLILVDDPVSGPEAAASALQRQRIFDWYQSVLRTRLAPGGAQVIVMSRWNELDLAGMLLDRQSKGGDHWQVLDLPAIAEENDPLDRAVGEALWPGRYDLPYLLDTKRAMTGYSWSALYQGHPTPDAGGMMHRSGFRSFTEDAESYILHSQDKPDEFVKKNQVDIFLVLDPAFGEASTNDWTATGVFGVLPGNRMLVLYMDTARRSGTDIAQRAVDLQRAWAASWIGLEDVGAQRWLKPMILERGGPPVKLIPARGSKVVRSELLSILWNDGSVYCAQAEWTDSYVEQLAGFPNASHDDMVDASAYGALYIVGKGGSGRSPIRLGPGGFGVGGGPSPWSNVGGGGYTGSRNIEGSSRPPWISDP